MNARQITKTVDSRIVEEDLPVRANLKVIRINAPDYGLTDDEIQDRNEFIRCYLLNELGAALLRRPLLTVSGSLYCFISANFPYLITFR